MRAAHLLGEGPYLFEDPFALEFAGEPFQELRDRGELRELFAKLGLQRIMGQVLARARWAEECLEQAVAAGAGQYVVLGAGLDSFALRRADLVARLRVFELDHPATQRYKRAALARLGFRDEGRVEFVEVDFEKETVGQALARSGFSATVPAFMSWLGVVSYLTHDAIFATLASLRERTAPGSQIALDYPIPPELMSPQDRRLFETVSAETARLGEPRLATHVPGEFHRAAEALGFELVEDLGPEQLEERYFAGRSDGLGPYPQIRLARLRVGRGV
jgi:methyltransferase (TIGR00027 family)